MEMKFCELSLQLICYQQNQQVTLFRSPFIIIFKYFFLSIGGTCTHFEDESNFLWLNIICWFSSSRGIIVMNVWLKYKLRTAG